MTGMSGQQDRSKFAPGTEEPLFNVKPAGMEPKLLEQCLIVLAGQNTESLKKVLLKQVGYNKNIYLLRDLVGCSALTIFNFAITNISKCFFLLIISRDILNQECMLSFYSTLVTNSDLDLKQDFYHWNCLIGTANDNLISKV